MGKIALVAGLLMVGGCATMSAIPAGPGAGPDRADPLPAALARAEITLRSLAADLATGGPVPPVGPALADLEEARVALAVRQARLGVRLEDLALGATLHACREGVRRLVASAGEAPAPAGPRRGFVLACIAPLSAAVAGLPGAAGSPDQRL